MCTSVESEALCTECSSRANSPSSPMSAGSQSCQSTRKLASPQLPGRHPPRAHWVFTLCRQKSTDTGAGNSSGRDSSESRLRKKSQSSRCSTEISTSGSNTNLNRSETLGNPGTMNAEWEEFFASESTANCIGTAFCFSILLFSLHTNILFYFAFLKVESPCHFWTGFRIDLVMVGQTQTI